MTKENAIKWFKDIQGGSGVNRNVFPQKWRGAIAKHVWNDVEFDYGVEYGVLIALMVAFDITEDDLK